MGCYVRLLDLTGWLTPVAMASCGALGLILVYFLVSQIWQLLVGGFPGNQRNFSVLVLQIEVIPL